ncbi:thiamine phosphate synthase [Bacteroidota bacterium]
MKENINKIIVLTSNHRVKNEGQLLTDLFREGLTHLHLRKHGYPANKIADLINRIPQEYHKQIILHCNFELLKKFDLGGMHVTRKRRKNWFFIFFTLNKYKNKPGFIITTSYHSTRKIEKSPDYYSYFFINSLFGSIHQGGKHAYKEPDKLREFLMVTKRDVVALGGIDLINIKSVREIGFKSVGLHGAIWGFENPVERFKELRNTFLS